jgi:hypothetical protein
MTPDDLFFGSCGRSCASGIKPWIGSLRLLAILSALTVMAHLDGPAPVSAQSLTEYVCTRPDAQRRIELRYQTNGCVPCRVLRFRDSGSGEEEWKAANETGYCEARVQEMISALQSEHYTCSKAKSSPQDSMCGPKPPGPLSGTMCQIRYPIGWDAAFDVMNDRFVFFPNESDRRAAFDFLLEVSPHAGAGISDGAPGLSPEQSGIENKGRTESRSGSTQDVTVSGEMIVQVYVPGEGGTTFRPYPVPIMRNQTTNQLTAILHIPAPAIRTGVVEQRGLVEYSCKADLRTDQNEFASECKSLIEATTTKPDHYEAGTCK